MTEQMSAEQFAQVRPRVVKRLESDAPLTRLAAACMLARRKDRAAGPAFRA